MSQKSRKNIKKFNKNKVNKYSKRKKKIIKKKVKRTYKQIGSGSKRTIRRHSEPPPPEKPQNLRRPKRRNTDPVLYRKPLTPQQKARINAMVNKHFSNTAKFRWKPNTANGSIKSNPQATRNEPRYSEATYNNKTSSHYEYSNFLNLLKTSSEGTSKKKKNI